MFKLMIIITMSTGASLTDVIGKYDTLSSCLDSGQDAAEYVHMAFNNSDKMKVEYECVGE